jgi:hypothetical protein
VKGRTTCPKCKHEFVLDIPVDEKKHEVICTKCKNKFIVSAKCTETKSGKECSWEEHGEPRKTILSAIKPRTNKPMIAAVILICVFSIGMSSAVFSEYFIESSLDVASNFGLTGTVQIEVTDISNISIPNVDITLGDMNGITDENGIFYAEKVELGIKTIELTVSNYKTRTAEILVTPFLLSKHTIIMQDGTGDIITNYETSGCSFILTIFSFFSLFGAAACLKRQHIDVAIVGSLIGIFSFGFFLAGSILSIIAFVLIMISRDEFENGKKGKVF